jgi:hypothetical protein
VPPHSAAPSAETAAAAAAAAANPAADVDTQPTVEQCCPQTAATTAHQLDTACTAGASNCTVVGATLPQARQAVECQVSWLGSFLFKGSHGLVEVAALSPVVLLGRLLGQDVPAGVAVGVPRAQCVVRRGVVTGRASMQLPATISGFTVG